MQTPKQVFLEAAQKFVPDIEEDDLKWAYAGTRAKAQVEKTSLFVLDRATPPLVNLIGIDSPGLSASMAIARYVAKILNSG